jgi:hypothetical protein
MYRKNHERFAGEFNGMGGKVFKTEQIKTLMLNKFPSMKKGSMLPNDHAKGNKNPCRCVCTEDRIFDRVCRAYYRVR